MPGTNARHLPSSPLCPFFDSSRWRTFRSTLSASDYRADDVSSASLLEHARRLRDFCSRILPARRYLADAYWHQTRTLRLHRQLLFSTAADAHYGRAQFRRSRGKTECADLCHATFMTAAMCIFAAALSMGIRLISGDAQHLLWLPFINRIRLNVPRHGIVAGPLADTLWAMAANIGTAGRLNVVRLARIFIMRLNSCKLPSVHSPCRIMLPGISWRCYHAHTLC